MDCLFTEQDLQHNVKGQREDTGIKNPFLNHSVHLNISMHILQTVPYKFPKVKIRRTCRASVVGDLFLYSCDHVV